MNIHFVSLNLPNKHMLTEQGSLSPFTSLALMTLARTQILLSAKVNMLFCMSTTSDEAKLFVKFISNLDD